MNTSFNAHTGDLFTSLKILNVNKLYVFNVALHMFKFKDGKCPESLNYMFKYSEHSYTTRQNYCYRLPLFRYKICQMNITYIGVLIWNHIKTIHNINCSYHSFKYSIKQYLLTNELNYVM